MNKSLLNSLAEDCVNLLKILGIMKAREVDIAVPNVNERPLPVVIEATMPLLNTFATAIRDYEGAPGDANYLNNNPGNCRYNPDGYLAKYEPVTQSPAGFAVFPSYEIGWEYLLNMLTQRIENHPNWTLLQFFNSYAPESDGNNSALYAAFVARRLGVTTDYQIKGILS